MVEPTPSISKVTDSLFAGRLVRCNPAHYGEVRAWLLTLLPVLASYGEYETALFVVVELRRMDYEMGWPGPSE